MGTKSLNRVGKAWTVCEKIWKNNNQQQQQLTTITKLTLVAVAVYGHSIHLHLLQTSPWFEMQSEMNFNLLMRNILLIDGVCSISCQALEQRSASRLIMIVNIGFPATTLYNAYFNVSTQSSFKLIADWCNLSTIPVDYPKNPRLFLEHFQLCCLVKGWPW